jgi:hypothetical protein
VLPGRGLCDGPIPRPEESYHVCVCVCVRACVRVCVIECDKVQPSTLAVSRYTKVRPRKKCV